MLVNGAEFTITTEDVPGDVHEVGTTYDGLPGDVQPGDRLLIDDGKVALECVRVDGPRVVTKVVEGGMVSDHKGINLPGVAVSVPALSEKDKDDLRWALHLQADLIALSFVRSAATSIDVRAIMDEEGVRLPVLAKIEKPQAVDNLAEIVDAFDGIMVARGDLGVELPLEDVPLVQTRSIELARRAAKPVIVATQMLESMIETSRPTRAEASDVANAVLDGTDALMLSGRDERREVPDRHRRDDGAHHRQDGGERASTPSRRSAASRAPRAARSPAPRPRWASCSAPGSWSRSPRAATPPAGCPGCARRSRCWRSRPSRRSAASWPWCGASRRSSRRT